MDNKIINFSQHISWHDLQAARHTSRVPFHLSLKESDDVLVCKEIVRVMPGKRLVVFGTWAGKEVVAKLFYQPGHARRHAKREHQGIQALLAAGVLTPTLYFQGSSTNERVAVLIFERILLATSVDELWQNRSSIKALLPLMQALTIELATQHVLGILQHDLHFKNFLVQKKGIYTIDGSDLEIHDQPLSKKESVENLGLYFSQLGVGTEELQKALFQIYTQARGWIVKKADVANLTAATEKWTQKRWDHYSKKIMRSCSAFVRLENINNLTLYDSNYEAKDFLQAIKNPEALFLATDTELLKAGRSTTVIKTKIDNRYFVIKRYNIKNSFHWLRRCFRSTRAAENWRLAQRLRLMGIPTAKPIAFIEKRFLGLRTKSYFIMEYIDGMHAGTFFENAEQQDETTQLVAQKMVLLFENLARLRITHGDLKMTNILIHQWKPILIDLDGMCEHKTLGSFKSVFYREIKRFMINWHDNKTVHDMFELLIEEIFSRLGMKNVAG
jgi:tRNA A-37 threonylcarbamoyl transferase component Bud32